MLVLLLGLHLLLRLLRRMASGWTMVLLENLWLLTNRATDRWLSLILAASLGIGPSSRVLRLSSSLVETLLSWLHHTLLNVARVITHCVCWLAW